MSNIVWKPASGGNVPAGAVQCGNEANGEALFLIVADHAGGKHPGKLNAVWSHGNIPYGGQEVPVQNYKVFCGGDTTWKAASGGQLPDGAIVIGNEANGEPLYGARARHDGGKHPGKFNTVWSHANISYGGAELHKTDYEILCDA